MAINSYEDPKTGETLFRIRVKRTGKNQTQIDRRVQGFKTRAEAEKAERKLLLQAERDIVVAEKKSELWESLVDQWEVSAKRGDIFIRPITGQTVDDYVWLIRKHCADWMKLHACEIDRARAWVVLDRVDREHSIGRRKRLRSAIDAVFKWGILSGRVRDLTVIPTDGYQTTKTEEEKLPEILNLEQIRSLLAYAQKINHLSYPHWALALLTGMRSGELYALEWDMVDFENRLIYVHRNWTMRNGFGPTKGRYWRAVPVEAGQVLDFLKELKAKREGEKFVLRHFQAWTDGEQAKILREFCIGSGLPSVKFHTLRACFATQLIRDGVAPAVIMKICGWKDLKTMQRYIRLSGIEVKGATRGLKLLPEREVMGRVVDLFQR